MKVINKSSLNEEDLDDLTETLKEYELSKSHIKSVLFPKCHVKIRNSSYGKEFTIKDR